MLEVDLDAQTIRAGIGDLVAVQHEGRGMGLLTRARAELGTRVHQAYRREREADLGFRAEVELTLERECDGFRALLRGRADGLTDAPDGFLLEEVKSVTAAGPELGALRADFFPDWVLQLRLYALALAPTGRPIEARLVLISLLDGSRRDLRVEPAPEATERKLTELLRAAIDRAREEQTEAATLAAAGRSLCFPYPAERPYQHELMAAIRQGLERGRPVLCAAPTGIGKTVSALLPALAFALERHGRLLFLTAKTTQQALVARTFEDLIRAAGPEAGALRCLTLRAKEKLCPPGHLLCHPEVCPLLHEFQTRLEQSRAIEQLLQSGPRIDPEAVLLVGESHRLCPFALSLALVPRIHLLIADYNYFYDPGVALTELSEPPGRYAVIVDEAHNLFDRARGYHSPFVGRAEVRSLRDQARDGSLLAEADRSAQLPLRGVLAPIDGPALFGHLGDLLERVEAAIADAQQAAAQENGGLLEDQAPFEPDRTRFRALGVEAQDLLLPYALYNRAHKVVRPRDPLLDLLGRLIRLRDVLGEGGREIVPYAAGPRAAAGPGVGSLCVNPASRLRERHRRALGTVAMSATLTPSAYWSDVLGFSGLDPVVHQAPSPFPRENLGCFIAPQVGTTLREREKYYKEIARLVRDVVDSRPGRYIAFFPSFQFLASVQRELGPLSGSVLVQIPGLGEEARRTLLERFRRGTVPKLLLAVMGGIFGEGVDLPGDELIGAIVVGLGLPQVGFERAVMERYFQEEYEQGFAYAMLYPGLQRVIQAAGRVIRTPDDQGVIVLADRRFAEPEVLACLPEHWYQRGPEELVTLELKPALDAFWSGHPTE